MHLVVIFLTENFGELFIIKNQLKGYFQRNFHISTTLLLVERFASIELRTQDKVFPHLWFLPYYGYAECINICASLNL